MKFILNSRSVAKFDYIIRPTEREMISGIAHVRRGLKAEFRNGFFDSEKGQEAFGWSDDERLLVEKRLQAHGDFGRGLYLDPSETPLDHNVARLDPLAPTPVLMQTMCLATVTTDGESVMCGRPTVDGEFCVEHHAAMVGSDA